MRGLEIYRVAIVRLEKPDIYLKPPARQPQVNRSIYVNSSWPQFSSKIDCLIVVKSIGFWLIVIVSQVFGDTDGDSEL